MTTETLTLTDFLLARIAEDEQVARVAGAPDSRGRDSADWFGSDGNALPQKDGKVGPPKVFVDSAATLVTYEPSQPIFAAHIVLHDPKRVLAQCKAHRLIVDLHPPRQRTITDLGITETEFRTTVTGPVEYDAEVRALAAVYADHPDYRDEWKP